VSRLSCTTEQKSGSRYCRLLIEVASEISTHIQEILVVHISVVRGKLPSGPRITMWEHILHYLDFKTMPLWDFTILLCSMMPKSSKFIYAIVATPRAVGIAIFSGPLWLSTMSFTQIHL
jgi:hypothetical protein